MPRKTVFSERSTEWLSARLPARVLAQVNLMARLNRESRAEIIVKALMAYANAFPPLNGPEGPVTVRDLADPVPARRLANLARYLPTGMSLEERLFLSRTTCEDKYWSEPAPVDSLIWPPERQMQDLRVDALAVDWERLAPPDSL